MDGPNPTRRLDFSCVLGLSLYLMLPGPTLAASKEELLRLAQTNAFNVKHYRVADSDYPRLGFLLPPDDIPPSGENFEFCDGSRAAIPTERLSLVKDSCGRENRGAFSGKLVMGSEAGAPIGKVYDADYNEIGEITDISIEATTVDGTRALTDISIEATTVDGTRALTVGIKPSESWSEVEDLPTMLDVQDPSTDFQIDSKGAPSILLRELGAVSE